MKNLNEYILEQSYDIDGLILEGKFWKAVGKMFGYNTEKVAQTMQKWSDDLRNGFTTGQYIAAKSKDKEVKKAAEEQAQAAEKGSKELLEKVKFEVQRLMKNMDYIKIPDHCMSQWNQLKSLSEKENDDEGKQLAEKFKGLIDKKFPDGGKEYEQIASKIEKAGVNDGPKQETSKDSDKGEGEQTETQKAAAEEVTDAIKSNQEVFKDLAKICKINGEKLRDYVSKYILSQDDNGKFKKKEDIKKITDEEVLGTCITVCGALITNNQDYFNRIAKTIGLKDKNKMQKYIQDN